MKALLLTAIIIYPSIKKLPPIDINPKKTNPDVVLVQPKKPIEWVIMVEGAKKFEGFYSETYICPGKKSTIGYGHTGKETKRKKITEREASEILNKDLEESKEKVLSIVKVPLNNYQLAALTSFTFNCGEGSLRKLVNGEGRLNSGNYQSVEKIMPLYRRANGKILNGLVKRRAWEVELWISKDYLLAGE